MIVFGFADDFNDLGETLTGDNPFATNVRQSLPKSRSPVTQKVGGASGVFDYYGDAAWPTNAYTLSLTFDLRGYTAADAEERARELIDDLVLKGRSRLWFVSQDDYSSEMHGSIVTNPTVGTISGTVREGVSPINSRVTIENSAGDIIRSISGNAAGGYSVTAPPGTYTARARYWRTDSQIYGEVTRTGIAVTAGNTTSGQDLTLATNAVTRTHRWAWAKLTAADEPIAIHGDPRAVQMSLEFTMTEGVMYSGHEYAIEKLEAAAKTFDLAMIGTANAPLSVWLAASGGNAITASRLTNDDASTYVNYAGSIASGKRLKIESDAYSVKNDDVADYANLSVATGQVLWAYIEPTTGGSQQFTLSLTQAVEDYVLNLAYRDVYEL